jgi:elongation factor P
MVIASQLRAGMAVRFEGQVYKVLAAEHHLGQGKMGGAAHARLKNLSTGALREINFRAELRLEEVETRKVPMDFLYADAEQCSFMNPETFDQISIPVSLVGPQAALLQADMRVAVDFVEGQPVGVVFPDVLEVRIGQTAPPSHAQVDSVWKPARLESGVEVMVPQFIKNGDLIRLDVANMKYMDRAKGSGKA